MNSFIGILVLCFGDVVDEDNEDKIFIYFLFSKRICI